MLGLTTVSCIGESMRTCRAIRTVARVDTRGMPVIMPTWMTRDPRVGRRRRLSRIPIPEDEEEEGYVQRKSPTLSVWYLAVINHLRTLFGNPKDAKLMSWHASAEHIKGNGKLRHPSDGKQWNSFTAKFAKEFDDEVRNITFALSTDGMNPFGDLSSSHNTYRSS